MNCSNRREWLRNILGTRSWFRECSKVVGFSLLELFRLYKVPPFWSPPCSPPSLSFISHKRFLKTHTHTHTVSAAWQLSREGLQCRSFSKSSLLAVLLMLAHQQQWSSRNAEHPALIKICPSFSTLSFNYPATLRKRASWSYNNELNEDITQDNTTQGLACTLLLRSTCCRTG